MKTTLQVAGHAYNLRIQLNKLARSMHRLDEAWCNGEIKEPKYFARQKKILKAAQLLADELSQIYAIEIAVFHQEDPRGASLYLIDKTMDYHNYNHGIALY